jgi:hypothetical protein
VKLISKKILLNLGVLAAVVYGQAAVSQARQAQSDSEIQTILQSQDRIKRLGFEKALQSSDWPKHIPETENTGDSDIYHDGVGSSGILGDDCSGDGAWGNLNCLGGGSDPIYNSPTSPNAQIKDDAVQILATEVLYQTLTYFKVKHVFGKVKDKSNTVSYAFKVISPVDGQPYQDLDSETVIYAIKQFRKYVIGLICNDPSPGRILSMMNRYDVGTRFRWDMAWALLGNDLPDAPNKFMRFGAKWRKFSAAVDGIENGSMLRIQNPNGDYSNINPNLGAATGVGLAHMGYIAKEIVGVMRLAGDIISALLELVCFSDLSVNQTKELQKKDVVYKLLEVKRKAYDRYGPLRPLLEEIGKRATEIAGRPISVMP